MLKPRLSQTENEEKLQSQLKASNPAQRKAFGDVVSNKVNNQGAGNYGQHTRRGQYTPVQTGCRYRAGHHRTNGLGVSYGESPSNQ